MTRIRTRRFIMHLTIICMCSGMLRAAEGVTLRVTAIKGSGTRRSDKQKIDGKLKHLESILRKAKLPHEKLELLHEKTPFVHFGGVAKVKLAEDYRFACVVEELKDPEKVKIYPRIKRGKKQLHKLDAKAKLGQSFILAGPKLSDGTLIVVVTVGPKKQKQGK